MFTNKRNISIVIALLVLCIIGIGLQINRLEQLTADGFEMNINKYVWLEDGRNYVLNRMGFLEGITFSVAYKGEKTSYKVRENSFQVEKIWRLRGRSSEDELIFKKGNKWYLGRMNSWSIYAMEHQIPWDQVVASVLREIYNCSSLEDIVSLRISQRQPYHGETLKEVVKTDEASKRVIWQLLTTETVYQEEWDNPPDTLSDQNEYYITIYFSDGSTLCLEEIKPDGSRAKMELCMEWLQFSEKGQGILMGLLSGF